MRHETKTILAVDTGGGSIAEIAGLAARRWKLALAVASVVFVVLALLIFSLQPVYKADVLLQLPSAPVDDTRQSSGFSRAGQTDPYLVATEMDVLSSDAIVRDVIRRLDLTDEPTFNRKSAISPLVAAFKSAVARSDAKGPSGPSTAASTWTPDELAMDGAVRTYRSGFSAYNDGRSMSAHLSFTGPDPRLAARIANTHAEIYVDLQTTRRTDAQKRVADLIAVELDRRKADLVAAEKSLAEARARIASAGVGGASVVDTVEAQRLVGVVSASRASVAQTGARLAEEQAALGSGILQSAQFVATDAKLVSPASVPIDKDFPKTALFLVMAAMLAGAAGILAALAAQARSGRSRRIAVQLSGLGLRVLGTMPRIRTSIRKRMGSAYWERIRFVRDNLVDQKKTGKGIVVVVASARPGEGKSTVAWALSRAFAASGRVTLLLDGDMRMAGTGRRRTERYGLSDILAGSTLLKDAVVQGADELQFLVGRGDHPGGVDALATGRMMEVAEEMRLLFDVVVVDTPPMAVVSDAILFAEASDKVVLVAKAGGFRADLVNRIVTLMRNKRIEIGGAVVTGIDQDDLDGVSRRQMRRYVSGPVPGNHVRKEAP